MTGQAPAQSARKIVHVDMDAFYASVEQRDNPDLRGKPVVVAWTGPRSVVCAASYEARRYGIHSAMSAIKAERLCPHAIYVPPDFNRYRDVSRQVRQIFARHTDLIEPLSLDEAYLDVTANRRGLPTATDTAREIRARILDETGLTASAGVSYNKFLAKLASDMNKPNGQCVIAPGKAEAVVEDLPVGRFHGVGPVTASHMNRLGIHTGADLRTQSLAFLAHHFGKSGSWYFGIARGLDERPVNPNRERKSSGSETTFETDHTAPEPIEAGVLAMADDVWAWCEKTGARGRTVTVKIKWGDFQQSTRSRSAPSAVGSREAIREMSLALIRSVYPPRMGIRLVGVTLSNFQATAEGAVQMSLA